MIICTINFQKTKNIIKYYLFCLYYIYLYCHQQMLIILYSLEESIIYANTCKWNSEESLAAHFHASAPQHQQELARYKRRVRLGPCCEDILHTSISSMIRPRPWGSLGSVLSLHLCHIQNNITLPENYRSTGQNCT